MKICLLAPANNPHTQRIASSLADKNYEIYICTFHKGSLSNVHVKYFPPSFTLLGKINYILNVPLIKSYLKKIKPDIVHAHYVSSYGVVASLIDYRPYIISVWGKDIYDAPNNILLKFLIKIALQKADCIFSTSETMAQKIKQYVSEKNIVITPFGVDLTKFHPAKHQRRIKNIIGTARILAPKYGINYLLKAFSLLVETVQDVELHIAGDGPQKKELVELTKSLGIEGQVKFYGFIEPNNMPAFFSKLDVFCMPSIEESESFGVAALEAQACGIPIVASAVGGLHETVIDTKTGYLVPPKDPQAIADKLLHLLCHQELRQQMGQKGREFVENHFHWSENIKIMENIYSTISL